MHLLESGGQQGQLQRGRGGQLAGVRVAASGGIAIQIR